MGDVPPTKPDNSTLRFIDSMPRPLLVLFIVGGVVAVVSALIFIIHPPRSATIPVQDRRPPPRGTLSHDVGQLVPVPLPSVLPSLPPACPVFAKTVLEVGPAGALRLRQVLADLCRLSHGGVPPELTTAIDGLEHATIRFAAFQRDGVESTLDFATGTVWLNLKFSVSNIPVEQVAPVMVHEGWHLAHRSDAVTAEQELDARRAEVDACRELMSIDKWPRWCNDARTLTDLPHARAIALLVSAGYRP
ncbi:MAG TPA: hypothetical protein VJ818_03450 [Actinomycetota bacterium]|nr:hypothetical protein [Actinomycetota bacterium]